MNSTMTRTTETWTLPIPSTFGMPACGHAFGSVDVITDVIGVQANEVRVKADMGLAARTYRGSFAWSPPPS